MHTPDHLKIQHYHNDKVIKYGKGSSQSQGWSGNEGQEKRFEILCSITNLNNCSVLDAGCGYGDLYGYLNSHFENIKYSGVDFQDSFIEYARQKYSQEEGATFLSGDFANDLLPINDYTLLSGALNYHHDEKDYAKKVISKLFQNCRLGFGFNMLGKKNFYDPLICCNDPEETIAFCKTLSSQIVFKEGYYENDFTVLMLK